MSEALPSPAAPPLEPARRTSPARRLARRWRAGERPDVDAFLAQAGGLGPDQVAAVLRVDQRRRWAVGEHIEAESYLVRHPAVRGDPDAALDLVYNEFLLREELGEPPALEEFLHRFPEYTEALTLQVALHRALDPDPTAEGEGEVEVEAEEPVAARGEGPPARPGQAAPEPAATAGFPSVPGYEIVRELGAGGMGIVYLARQVGLKRRVALKMVLAGAHADAEQLERFHFEAEAAARLHHPNIVEIYEIGAREGCPYFSLEYVDGGTLAQRLTGQPHPARRAAELIHTLARAVHDAHQHGIIHRDLKPANVMLTADGVPKITDFGLAKQLDADARQTQTGTILGSPCYMAPEQALGKVREVGPATDVYALGAILYELLTGVPPFRADTALDTLQQLLVDEPVRPGRRRPGIPRDLETICLKCLEKAPHRRYATADALVDDLNRFLNYESIKARPLGVPARLWRWCRRKSSLAAALGLAAAAVLVAVGIAVRFAVYQYHAAARLADLLAEVQAGQRQNERLAANLAYEHGQALCEQGDVGQGLLWLVRGLGTAGQADAVRLQDALRANLAGWRSRLHTLAVRWEHAAPLHAVAVSPDGRTVLTGGEDGLARTWEAATGRPVGPTFRHPVRVGAVAFSPDGRAVLLGCDDRTARLWDARTGRPLAPPLRHALGVDAVAFSPDGRTVATGCADGAARLWDARTGQALGRPMRHDNRVVAVAFSPDHRVVLTASWDRTARLWDARTGQPLGPPLAHDEWVVAVAFSPDGRIAVTGCYDRTARLWDVATRRPIGKPLPHLHCVSSVAFSPDGRTLLSGCLDATARLWDAHTGQPIGSLLRHPHIVSAVAFGRDGRSVVTVGFDKTVRVWRIARADARVLSHAGFIRQATFSPDGGTILSASMDRTARLWDARTGRPRGAAMIHQGAIEAVAFSPDGRAVVTGSFDKTARLWDARTGQPLGPALGHDDGIDAVAFSPDGRTVATGSNDHTARLWDAATSRPLGAPLRHGEQVKAVAFSPDGRAVATASYDRTARLWDARTGSPLGPPLRHRDWVTSVAFSPDGRAVLTASADMTAQLWDAATGRPLGAPLRHQGPVSVAVFGTDGRTVITGGWDRTARLWDAATAAPMHVPMHHLGTLRASAMSPDGRLVLTGSYDRTAQLWDKLTGKPIGPAFRHENQVWFVAFSPDGRTVLTGGQENVARLWSVPPPLRAAPDAIELELQVASGMELADEGTARILTTSAWQERRSRLEPSDASLESSDPAAGQTLPPETSGLTSSSPQG
jgi:WD40 repeat protein